LILLLILTITHATAILAAFKITVDGISNFAFAELLARYQLLSNLRLTD
jgi:hypothetical protein